MKTKIITAIFILLILQCSLWIKAAVSSCGKGSLSGKIINSYSNLPIQDASIELFSASDSSLVAGTITDQQGSFTVFRLDSGKYYLVVKARGFEKNMLNPFTISPPLFKINLGEIGLQPVKNMDTAARPKSKFADNRYRSNQTLSLK
jgi:hypothetical protein